MFYPLKLQSATAAATTELSHEDSNFKIKSKAFFNFLLNSSLSFKISGTCCSGNLNFHCKLHELH